LYLQIEIGDKKKQAVYSYLKTLHFKWIKTIRHDHFFIKKLNRGLKNLNPHILNIYYSVACFIESLTLPLSKPITLTFTSSPSLTTSVTLATLLSASSEI
jgi:hypothetical protein